MKSPPEVFVDQNWMKTINFILFKLNPNNELILTAENSRMKKMALSSIITILCDERKFYREVKKWDEKDSIKVHLTKV